MEEYEKDDTLIARWVAGELSEEELAEFEKSDAYHVFHQINEEAQKFKAPPINTREALIKTKEKISFGKKQSNPTIKWLTIAASIAILIGIFGVFTATKSYQTANGQHLVVTLPDGSVVQLNDGSKLTHKRFFWLNNKTVTLQGEAYFKVQKSDGFVVNTTYGNVAVLGTQFNVKSRSSSFELDCFEGVVRFDRKDHNEQQILRKNDRVVLSKNTLISETISKNEPNWINGINVFKDTPLINVIEEIQRQYNVTFEIGETNTTRLFTGSFLHDNLEAALKSTLTPMGINYTISKDKTIVQLP
ncbi:FecR family protein [Aquimarina rhabdastrellae]